MQILDNFIILTLPVLAFIAGMKVSKSYYMDVIDYMMYLLRLNNVKAGQYAPPPPVPRRRRNANIGQYFMDRLHENGHATQRL